MTQVSPAVAAAKCFMSAFNLGHGMSPRKPIPPSISLATIIETLTLLFIADLVETK
jgi:hypothetical protein